MKDPIKMEFILLCPADVKSFAFSAQGGAV